MSADERELVRLASSGSGAPDDVRRALEAASLDVPSNERVEQMLARFPFPPPNDGGAGPTEGGPSPSGQAGAGVGASAAAGASKAAGLKLALALGAVTVAAAGTVLALRAPPEPSPAAPTQVAAPAPASDLPALEATNEQAFEGASGVASASARASAPVAAPPALPKSAASAAASAAPSASAAPPRAELELLKEAHQLRAQDPSRALALVNEHASAYPKSAMGQEREMIRIEALLNSGKRAEAKALADAFRAKNPTSAYARRLDALFPP